MSGASEHVRYILQARKIIRTLHKQKPFDVCHCHFIIPTGLAALWCKNILKIPYIITIHGSDVPGYNPDRFRWMHSLISPVTAYIARQAAIIVSPSDYLAQLLTSQISGLNVARINYGFELYPTEGAPKQDIVLSTGRFLPRKGFLTLLQAVQHEDFGFELHLCGDGPLREEIEAIAATSATKVVLHGWLDNQGKEFKNLLDTASTFVLLSSKENSSVSIMEAMYNKCAVIAADSSGCVEMVSNVGICINPQDLEALKLSLRKLMNDKTLRTSFGEQAHLKIVNNYDAKKVVDDYLQVLQNVIDMNVAL